MLPLRLLLLPSLALVLLPSALAYGTQASDTIASVPSAAPDPADASQAIAQITYQRDWPQQKVPFFRITVRQDGTGTYTAAPPSASQDVTPPVPAQTLRISAATRDILFAAAPIVGSPRGCDTGDRHTAQTGRKTLTIEDPTQSGGHPVSCTFNYSDNHQLQDAVTAFNSIASTLEQGTHLAYLLRFDHLGLDSALATLLDEAKGGRAIELQNIAPVLQKIASDDNLMQRARERAVTLLSMAASPTGKPT